MTNAFCLVQVFSRALIVHCVYSVTTAPNMIYHDIRVKTNVCTHGHVRSYCFNMTDCTPHAVRSRSIFWSLGTYVWDLRDPSSANLCNWIGRTVTLAVERCLLSAPANLNKINYSHQQLGSEPIPSPQNYFLRPQTAEATVEFRTPGSLFC